jgi:UDP-N-acetylglucosamine 1-carboxyvinyltransferase
LLTDVAPWWTPPRGRTIVVTGRRQLAGTIAISGAKNGALPLMIVPLLTRHPVTLHNLPQSLDVVVLATLLDRLGVTLQWSMRGTQLALEARAETVRPEALDAALVGRMRASFLLLGALLARCGAAALPLPGGDAIGLRAVDYHLDGLRAMGAAITLESGLVRATAPRGLHGAEIVLPRPSVGATENLLLAAALADGVTVIRNAAREPEIADLAQCLKTMGAAIVGIGGDALTVTGRAELDGTVHHVLPDRIELGTYACAAALTDGELRLTGADPTLLGAALPVFEAAGIVLKPAADGILVRRHRAGLIGVDAMTQPFPGFATDLQPQLMTLLCLAKGAGMITEAIFERRFQHVGELQRMGANITVHGASALIRGVRRLGGARVEASDVRAGAALVLAGLVAEGETVIGGVEHIDRGYDGMAEKLADCSAAIRRESILSAPEGQRGKN